MFIKITLPIKKNRMAEIYVKGICETCLDLHMSLGKSAVRIPKMFQCHVFDFRCKCTMEDICVYIYIYKIFNVKCHFLWEAITSVCSHTI